MSTKYEEIKRALIKLNNIPGKPKEYYELFTPDGEINRDLNPDEINEKMTIVVDSWVECVKIAYQIYASISHLLDDSARKRLDARIEQTDRMVIQSVDRASQLCALESGLKFIHELEEVLREEIEGVEYDESNKSHVPTFQIGAIIQGSVENSQIQAIASAVNSTVRQVVENTSSEDFRRIIAAAVEDMVQAVKGELNLDELSEYLKLAKDFQNEIARQTPDKSGLRRLLSGLSFLADIEGTVSFGDRALKLAERVLPYVPLIVNYLNRL
jgi:hypothetical protein